MHQDASISNIIGMVILNLEVIYRYRSFENLVLHLLDNDIFTIDENKNITRPKVNCIRPTLNRGIEGVGRCRNDLFAVDKYVD